MEQVQPSAGVCSSSDLPFLQGTGLWVVASPEVQSLGRPWWPFLYLWLTAKIYENLLGNTAKLYFQRRLDGEATGLLSPCCSYAAVSPLQFASTTLYIWLSYFTYYTCWYVFESCNCVHLIVPLSSVLGMVAQSSLSLSAKMTRFAMGFIPGLAPVCSTGSKFQQHTPLLTVSKSHSQLRICKTEIGLCSLPGLSGGHTQYRQQGILQIQWKMQDKKTKSSNKNDHSNHAYHLPSKRPADFLWTKAICCLSTVSW